MTIVSSSTLTQAEPGPTSEAIDKYRRMVFDAADNGRDDIDPAILEGAWKLTLDATADSKIYRSRLAASEDLNTRVPKLQAEARRLADVAAAGARIGTRPVSDFPTVRELLVALNETAAYATAGAVSPQKLAASQAANEVSTVRQAALTLLRETADRALGQQIGELFTQVASLDGAIRGRQEILDVESKITECESRITRYAADDREFFAEPAETRRVSSREMYLKARRQLEQLRGLASQRPNALAANAADQARIVELRQQIAGLERQRLEPKNMRWHDA